MLDKGVTHTQRHTHVQSNKEENFRIQGTTIYDDNFFSKTSSCHMREAIKNLINMKDCALYRVYKEILLYKGIYLTRST